MAFANFTEHYEFFRSRLQSYRKQPKKESGFAGCGKTQSKGPCNKGTALAGPLKLTEE
jgi:hypothetical protein